MAEPRPIHVLQLYPRDMNIYGDFGNALVLQRRLQWRGFEPILHSYDPEDEFPEQVDIVIGGGGQDSGQDKIQQDLLRMGEKLHTLADGGTPMLMICGLYQLFGHSFRTREGREIKGVGILDLRTEGTDTRLIGNVVAESKEFGEILGYENHSGQTYLGPGVQPLARVTKGEGNNAKDPHEGARFKNIVGSYLHGSLLPKNPAIADFLIARAVENRYDEAIAPQIDPAGATQPIEELTRAARATATRRPR